MNFVHLRAQTHASLKQGLMDSSDLVAKAKENNHWAVALTELDTLSSAVSFYTEAKKEGVKPIIGLDASIETDLSQPDNEDSVRLLLLAKNEDGYKKLMQLITRANVENVVKTSEDDKALIKQSWLKEMDCSSLIALSGRPDSGEIPKLLTNPDYDQQELNARLRQILPVYQSIFTDNNFFLEVARVGDAKEDLWVERMTKLSMASRIPLVATHGVLFSEREDFFAHEVHAAITTQQSVTDPEYLPVSTREQYYRSTEEMEELFSDLPQALENASLVAQMCNAKLDFGVNHLPNYPIPEGKTIEQVFIEQVNEGLQRRMEELFPNEEERALHMEEYQSRLNEEIDVIVGMEFPGYFLVVSDFIRWSKEQGIPVGPGRGSGAGSLVAYSMDITDIDPIKYNLLFERFLNPERVSMPDIDIDFCRDRRGETINYIFDKYGADAVAQISTFNTLAARAAIRHAGKALNYPLPLVDMVAKMIPKVLDISIEQSLEFEEKLKDLYDNDKRVRRLLDMAMKVEDTSLTTGLHAGGVIIAPGRIDEYSPMMRAQGKDVMMTQYTKDDAEKAGLIKFDLLGIKTLTAIQQAVELINQRPDRKDNPLDIRKIDYEDKSAMQLLRNAETYGVFQLESKGMRELLTALHPDNFEDVVALLALYRPGPMKSGMVDNFVARKHGQAEISYYHPSLEDILKPTYGVIVYQEQVMQIAQIIAGYTLGGADLLRRAMGKKKPEEMAKERIKFEAGAEKNGIDKELATQLFDAMEKFAEYGFNRSHSAAYAVLSIQTAYLKQEYPAEFFAAYMNVEIDKTDVLSLAVEDARNLGLEFILPNINTSEGNFIPRGEKVVEYGLGGLKGVSVSLVNDIVACRNEHGPFESLKDFLYKVNDHLRLQGRNAQMRQVTKSLIQAGAFDSINDNRAQLMAQVDAEIDYLGKLNRRQASGNTQEGEVFLPALWKAVNITPVPAPLVLKGNQKPLVEPDLPDASTYEEWSQLDKLQHEFKACGFYLSEHPYEAHAVGFDGIKAALPLSEVPNTNLGKFETVLIAGVVEDVFERNATSGKMAWVTISDGVTPQRVTIFRDQYASSYKKLKVGQFIGLEVNIRPSQREGYIGTMDISAQQVFDKNDLTMLLVDNVHIACQKDELEKIKALQKDHHGDRIGTVVHLPDGEDRYFKAHLPKVRWNDTQEALQELQNTFPNRIKMEFMSKINFKKPFKNTNTPNRSFSKRP